MTDQLFDIAGKIALITGGTSGIGYMMARGFVARGCTTYITGRDQKRADEVAAEIAAQGGTCYAISADLENTDGPRALASAFAERERELNILVNNAGTGAPGGLDVMTPQTWDLVLNVNTRAVFFLTQQLLPQLKAAATAEDPGRIINVGSIGGMHVPEWESHAYGASKAAVHHLTRSLAKFLGPYNITVNAIAPGPFPSRMNDTNSETMQERIAAHFPIKRAGTPDDMVGLAVFYASRAGAYVNGMTIPLDGGYLAAL